MSLAAAALSLAVVALACRLAASIGARALVAALAPAPPPCLPPSPAEVCEGFISGDEVAYWTAARDGFLRLPGRHATSPAHLRTLMYGALDVRLAALEARGDSRQSVESRRAVSAWIIESLAAREAGGTA